MKAQGNGERPTISSGSAQAFASLVHHIELSSIGWWDAAVRKLLLGLVAQEGQPVEPQTLVQSIRSQYGVRQSQEQLLAQIQRLRAENSLLELPDGRVKLPEALASTLAAQAVEGEKLRSRVQERFHALLGPATALQLELLWSEFNEQLLLPMVKELGAVTYSLYSGSNPTTDHEPHIALFLERFPEEERLLVRDALIAFLDPKDRDTRGYVLSHLNACFFLEATGLSGAALEALSAGKKNQGLRLFLDTNVLFSALNLHSNPANEATESVLEICKQISSSLSTKFYVLPPTIDEARHRLVSEVGKLQNLVITQNVAEEVRSGQASGLMMRFVEVARRAGPRLTAHQFFGPYIDNLLAFAKSKEIELFNADVDRMKRNQACIDDHLDRWDWEKKQYKNDAKSYEQIGHDVLLWHLVKQLRPGAFDSPLDARDWVVTADYRLLGFDRFRTKKLGARLPICVHPAALLQLLQFWVPRNENLEQAILGSFRLPFLFYDFDQSTEQATIRVLEALSRIENVGDLASETVQDVLYNRALHQRLSESPLVEARIELVHAAIVESNKRIAQERDKEIELRSKAERENAELQERIRQVEEGAATQREKLELQLAHLEGSSTNQRDEASRTIARLAAQVESMQLQDEAKRRDGIVKRVLFTSLYFPGLIAVILSLAIAYWLLDRKAIVAILASSTFLSLSLLFISGRFLSRLSMRPDSPLKVSLLPKFRRWRRILGTVTGGLVLGLLVNWIWYLLVE